MARESCFCRPAGVSAGLALLLLLALAGCQEGMGSVSQTPVVTIAPAADSVAAGSPLQFVVRAAPAPRADLAVGVTITPSGCELTDPPTSVTITAGRNEATLTVSTSSAGVGEAGCEVTAAIAEGEDYRTGNADAASASATVTPERQTPEPQEPGQPVVTVVANASTVTGGSEVSFTLTATPAPASDLTVAVRWSEQGSFLPASPPETVTIPTTGTVELKMTIPNDRVHEDDGSVTVTVEAGSGYTVGSLGAATVAIASVAPSSAPSPRTAPNPFVPTVAIEDGGWVTEGATIRFRVKARPYQDPPLTVHVSCSHSPEHVLPEFAHTLVGSPSVLDGRPPSTVEISTLVEPKDGHPHGVGILSVATEDDDVPEVRAAARYDGDWYVIAGGVTCTIMPSTNYRIGGWGIAEATVLDNDFSVLSIAADADTVEEGQPVSYTLTADPAPKSNLAVKMSWNGTRFSTVTIPALSHTVTFSIAPGDYEYIPVNSCIYALIKKTNYYLIVPGSSAAGVDITEADN